MNTKNELSELDKKTLDTLKKIRRKCSTSFCFNCALLRFDDTRGSDCCLIQELTSGLACRPYDWNLERIQYILSGEAYVEEECD